MRLLKLIIVSVAIILSFSALSLGQVIIRIKPDATQVPQANNDDEELIRAVFDPITDELKLTPSQKFRIVVVATETMSRADAVFDQIDDLDAQLSRSAFSGQLDETQIKTIAAQEAALLSEVVAMKARAKMAFYKVLTDEQRAMVMAQYRSENIGSLSNLDR